MSKSPLFYHPTTLYWVDDDALLLDVAADRFSDDYTVKTECSPKEAISFFSKYQPHINPLLFFQGCEQHDNYDLSNHLPVNLDFNKLREIQSNVDKFQDIAVMIVDYHMPEMLGLALCKQLSSIPVKKILLTGNADLHETIKAFNDGLIHCYICKDDPNIDKVLSDNIDRLAREYFTDRTQFLRHHIESDYKLPQSDPVFIDFFDQLCKKNNIKEFYLSDKNGGLLIVNGEGKTEYLVIHTDRTLDNFTELHSQVDEVIFFVKTVNNRTKIPFFGVGEEMWGLEALSWSNCFYTPTILQGKEKYYWALIPQTTMALP